MMSFDYHLNPLYPIKECSSCGALYTTDDCCSVGILEDKIICDLDKTPELSQRSPQNCPKCRNPVYGHYCQGCALLREKFKEDLFASCVENEILQDSSGPSNENSNVANALREPFVVNLDPGIFYHQCTCKLCGNSAHYGYNCPPKVPIIHDPEPFNNHTIKELPPTVQSFDPKFDLVHNSPNCQPMNQNFYNSNSSSFDQSQPLHSLVIHQPPQERSIQEMEDLKQQYLDEMKHLINSEYRDEIKIVDLKENFNGMSIEINKKEKLQQLKQWANLNTYPSKRFNSFCYDDEDYTIAVTPSLLTEEPDNSLSIRDEHLDTIPATESNEFIKSSVENLIPIPSESEGIPDNMCDVPFHDNSPPLDVSKDQFEDFFDSNDKFSLNDDDSFYIDNIDYVEASPPDSELVSSEVTKIVIPKVGGIDDDILLTIKDDILREKLLNINLLITKIEALNDNPTPSSDFMTNSGSTNTHSDIFLPEYEAFYDDHEYFYKFADELIYIISPPEYDCFFFKIKPNSGDFTMDVVEDISPTREPRVHNALSTHPTLQLNLEFNPSSESLFTYVVWTFLLFLLYSVVPPYLLSLRNEDTIFDPGICNYHFISFRPDVSHRCGTFLRFKVLNESTMEILSSTCSPMDQ
nr:hypothetical protein [Tanacetum cinerariifolium]